jgi:molecular chaperone GrpE
MADKKKRRGQDEEPEAVDNAAPVTPDPDRGDPSDDDFDREPSVIHDLSSHEEFEDEAEEVVEVEEPAVPDPEDIANPDDPELTLSDEDAALLDKTAADIVAEMRTDMLRAQAELVNFRTRVERDRAANRESVIAEVIRSLLPALDDLNRAEKHGDLEGSPLEIVAQKIRASFERYGLTTVGVKGEEFDPHLHEAVVQLPNAEVKVNTVADVIETGYALGERLIRAAKVVVSVPE